MNLFYRLYLIFLASILLATAAFAFNPNTIDGITSKAAVKIGSSESLVVLENKSFSYIESFDEGKSLIASSCQQEFWNLVDLVVQETLFIADYTCPSSNQRVVFDQPFMDYIVNGTEKLLKGEEPLPVLTRAQFESGGNANPTAAPNESFSTPTPQPTAYASGLTDEDVAAIRDFLNQQAAQGQSAQVEAEVLKQVNDYSCFLTSAQKLDYYSRWNGLSDQARNCLPQFLTLNVTSQGSFASQCSFLNAQYDPYGANFLAQFILDEYAKSGFAVTTLKTFKTVFVDEQGEQSVTKRDVIVYMPKRVSPACFAEFDKLRQENSLGTEKGWTIGIVLMLFIIGGLLAYMKLEGESV